MFEDVRLERSLILIFSLRDPNLLKQSEFTDDEKIIIKDLALEKLNRVRLLQEYIAIPFLEYYLLFNE